MQLKETPIKCDNKKYLTFTKNRKHHSKIKHIYIQYYFMRKKFEMEVIDINYCAINDIFVDLLTNVLGLKAFN